MLRLLLARAAPRARQFQSLAALQQDIFIPGPPVDKPKKGSGGSRPPREPRPAPSRPGIFGTEFEENLTTAPAASGKRVTRRLRPQELQLEAEAVAENAVKAKARAEKAKKEVLARMVEHGSSAEEVMRVEQQIDVVAENEIKNRNKIGKNRIPLLGFKPGELLVFHDEKLNSLRNDELDSRVILTKRVVRMTRGGKRPTQSALVAVGDRKGNVGFSLGRAQDAGGAVDNAITRAARRLVHIPRYQYHTIYHEVHGRFKRTRIFMLPAQPGKGLKCHHIIAKICELVGIQDLTANVLGSQNPLNVVRATLECLKMQRRPAEVGAERGMSVLEFRFPDDVPRVVARHQPQVPRQTPITVIKQTTENWFMTFPRIPWPAEFELSRAINDRLLRSKLSTDAELLKQIESDKTKHNDLVEWLVAMPSLADPRGTLLYPQPELLSPAAQAAYEKPIKPRQS